MTVVDRERIKAAPARSAADILRDSPGVFVRQGNGPRDISISIRGNNARNIAGVRNLKAYEDGFLITQPDGQSRFDLVDPKVYGTINVLRGPQSAQYGNYATGGVVDFRTRTGAQIDGFEVGTDIGSFGYFNKYATIGKSTGPVDIALFLSDARGTSRSDLPHSGYDTQTLNFTGRYQLTPNDRIIVKAIDNVVTAQIPTRASLDQFSVNPFQRGCGTRPLLTPGCPSFAVFNNGAFGPTSLVNSSLTGGLRRDRRTIFGARWEHDFDQSTTWRTQIGYDNRSIYQPTVATGTNGRFPSINIQTDLSHNGTLYGLPSRSSVALTYDTLSYQNRTANILPVYGPLFAALTNYQEASHWNAGLRARTEIDLSADWLAFAGFSAERSRITGRNIAFANSALGSVATSAFADRNFVNAAPEFGLQYRISPELTLRGRVAAGYGTPSPTFLFVNALGLAGNNTSLQSQRNVGVDLGFDWKPLSFVTLGVTGYYEFFRNEIVSQSPGAGLMTYNFNAPRSTHRGVEVFARAQHDSGWNGLLAYSLTDQYYTNYVEQISAGARSTRFDRAGFKIPGVPLHTLTARVGYEQSWGPLRGLGAYLEGLVQSQYFVDNANLVKIPGFGIVNANIHYVRDYDNSFIKKATFYVEARNLLNRNYISSVNIISNTISAATGALNPASSVTAAANTVYGPGEPRGIFVGLKLSL